MGYADDKYYGGGGREAVSEVGGELEARAKEVGSTQM
jgi:hypothetical protein